MSTKEIMLSPFYGEYITTVNESTVSLFNSYIYGIEQYRCFSLVNFSKDSQPISRKRAMYLDHDCKDPIPPVTVLKLCIDSMTKERASFCNVLQITYLQKYKRSRSLQTVFMQLYFSTVKTPKRKGHFYCRIVGWALLVGLRH